MDINILEPITQNLAADVLTKVGANNDSEINVNIMSMGGDVLAGSAIIDALKMSPAKVTTKVYGIAASMASAISQAGDVRMIADDAIFQPHNSAALPMGRPTKENLKQAAQYLEVVDEILLKSYSKSNLSQDALKALLIEDKPMNAQKALDLAFFDSKLEPIKAAATLNKLIMADEKTLTQKLAALTAKFLPQAQEAEVVTEEAVVAAPVEEGEPTRDLGAEIDALVALVEQLIEKMSPLPAPTVEETVAAVMAELKTVKSTETVPQATHADLAERPEVEEVGILKARQKEIQSKFKNN